MSTHARGKARAKDDLGTAIWFMLPNILGFLLFTLIPVAVSLVMSFYDWPLTGERAFVGLQNFAKLLTKDVLFAKVARNTLYYVCFYVIFNVFVALGLAVWLSNCRRFTSLFRSVFFLPQMIMIVSSTMIFKMLLQPEYGLINTVLAWLGISGANWLGSSRTALNTVIFISIWQGFGYNMIIFISGLLGVPQHLKEAARIDGCGAIRTFINVTLPMMSPSIFFAVVMTIISSFQVFDQTFVTTQGGPANATNTVVLYLYNNAFMYNRLGYASAIAWLLFAVISVITMVQMALQRSWVSYDA